MNRQRTILAILFVVFSSLLVIRCSEESEEVVGPNRIEELEITAPSLLANGIATETVIAVVYDSTGQPAKGIQVFFTASHGEISERDITDQMGQAYGILTSVASETDIEVTVTATVFDSTAMKKRLPVNYRLSLNAVGTDSREKLAKPNSLSENSAQIQVFFLGVTMIAKVDENQLSADGVSYATLQVQLKETTSKKGISAGRITLRAAQNVVAEEINTDSKGTAEVQITSMTQSGPDTVYADYGNLISQSVVLSYVKPRLELTPALAQLVADGKSKLEMTARLISYKNNPIVGTEIRFTTTAGVVTSSATTNESGEARAELISAAKIESDVNVIASFYEVTDTATVSFVSSTEQPISLMLSADPGFIWVKETGNLEQTAVTATVLTQSGLPIVSDVAVKFSLRNYPKFNDSPETNPSISPALPGSTTESELIQTVDGVASVDLRSGFKSGTVEIQAQLPDFPEVGARTAKIVVRSGPPYIYIDEKNKNNFIAHMTLASDYLNLLGWNFVDTFNYSVYMGDKYNNPVEQETAVYLTTSGGIITSDVVTCEMGTGNAVLMTANPRPVLYPQDPNALDPLNIPNPNDENLVLPIFEDFFDFDFDGRGNNGVAIILAQTHGQDQNGNDAVVFDTHRVIFSGPLAVFDVQVDRTSLEIGEYATIDIQIEDLNGNPVARGSSLTVSSSDGQVSSTNLMPTAEDYGYGSTRFRTHLLNNLDPEEGKAKTAEVTVELKSPNGTASATEFIYLKGAPETP